MIRLTGRDLVQCLTANVASERLVKDGLSLLALLWWY